MDSSLDCADADADVLVIEVIFIVIVVRLHDVIAHHISRSVLECQNAPGPKQGIDYVDGQISLGQFLGHYIIELVCVRTRQVCCKHNSLADSHQN